MAYGVKYRFSYCDHFKADCTLDILEKDYTGAIKPFEAQKDPIVISQEGSDFNKFDALRPSTASIGLIGNANFTLAELFTADERKYMVESRMGGVLKWRGFVIPNGFSHEWSSGNFPMEIIASDNLATLKDFQFLNDDGTVIKGRLNHIDILLKCLNKLDINIDLLTLTGIVRQGGVTGEDPLFINTTDAYTFLDTKVREEGIDFYYENPENAFNCEDVVKAICRLYGAKLYQNNGYWTFKRVNIDYGASLSGLSYNRYNQSGAKVGNVAYPAPIIIPCRDVSGNKIQFSGALMSMSEVYKSASARYAYRYLTVGDKLPPIIKNQELLHIPPTAPPISFVPTDWTVKLYKIPGSPPGDPIRTVNIAPELQPSGDFPPNVNVGAVRIWGGNRNGIDSLRSNTVNANNISKGDRLSFKFWHKTPDFNSILGPASFYCMVRVILISSNGRKTWALKNSDIIVPISGENSTSIVHNPSWIEVDHNASVTTAMTFFGKSPVQWLQEYIISNSAPEEGTLTIEFAGIGFPDDAGIKPPDTNRTGSSVQAFVPVDITGGVDDYTLNYAQKKLRIYNIEYKISSLETGVIVEGDGNPTGEIYTSEQSAKYTQRGSQIPLITSDVQDKNAISGILTLGNFVDKWNDSRNPYDAFKPLGLMLTRDIMRQYKNVWRVIQEDIRLNGLSFDTTIEFEERPGERYIIQRGSISSKFNKLIGATLIQVSANPDTPFVGSETIEEDFSSSGGSSGGGGSGGGGGAGSAPQDLQAVTDVGATTNNIITVKGTINTDILTIPDVAPLSPEAGLVYLHTGDFGGGGVLPPQIDKLVDLLDTNIVSPANGQTIEYNTSTGKWINVAGGSGGATKLSDLTDTSIIGAGDGQIIRYSSAWGWYNTSLPISTSSVLGLVKIGSGINVEPDGTISVQSSQSYILPIATQSVLGGVKKGQGVDIASDGTISVDDSGVDEFADLTDTQLTLLKDADNIKWSSALSKWVNTKDIVVNKVTKDGVDIIPKLTDGNTVGEPNDISKFTIVNNNNKIVSTNNEDALGGGSATELDLINSGGVYRQFTLKPLTQYTFSIYVKRGTASNVVVTVWNNTSWNSFAPQLESTSTSWVRLTKTFTTSSNGIVRINIGANSYPIPKINQGVGSVFVFGLKVEEGNSASAFRGNTLGLSLQDVANVNDKVRDVEVTGSLAIPKQAPSSPEAGKAYLHLGDFGSGSPMPPSEPMAVVDSAVAFNKTSLNAKYGTKQDGFTVFNGDYMVATKVGSNWLESEYHGSYQ